MSNSSEHKNKQEQRERRRNNRFYERLAVILVFILLLFTGISMFTGPREKLELNFDKLNISEDAKHEETVKMNTEPAQIEENINVNEELNKSIQPKRPASNYTSEEKKRIIEMRKKNMQDILDKKFSVNKKPQPYKYTTPVKSYNNNYTAPKVRYEENIPIQESPVYETPSYEAPSPSIKPRDNFEDYFNVLLNNTTCRREEIEYILKLFTSKYSNPITLVFRRNGHQTGTPEIIYATLPNNQWKDISESIGNVMQTLFDELLKDDNPSANSNMKKVTALITTECSESQYVSQSFYVSSSTPATTTISGAQSYCTNRHGRLPDILELISIVTHKKLPSGYYMTNSQRLSTDINGQSIQPLGDYMVLELRGTDIYFHSSSKLPTQSVYAECVLR